jgi:AcrR family transcriptional regulator
MRYPPEHKSKTHAQIVRAAGRLFRLHGFNGVGIDEIMDAAGLTRGGFYGYFASKADLFAAVIEGEHDFNKRMAARKGDDSKALMRQAMEVVSGYLDPENRTRVGRGCAMASLSVDVARSDGRARNAYTAKIEALADEFKRGMKGSDAERRAMLAIVLCVGGLTIARAINDDGLADRLEIVCREEVARVLADAGA